MARPLRHRQTKGAETDTPGLTFTAPHSYSTVKTIACGNAGCFRCTRLLVCVLPMQSAREAAGATGTRRSPRPPWAEASSTPRALRVARARVFGFAVCRHCERSEAIHLSFCGDMDCFAALAMTIYYCTSSRRRPGPIIAGVRGCGMCSLQCLIETTRRRDERNCAHAGGPGLPLGRR